MTAILALRNSLAHGSVAYLDQDGFGLHGNRAEKLALISERRDQTGEVVGYDSLDGQTPYGKVPAEVAHHAKAAGLPVIALAGTIGKGVTDNFDHGIDAFASILARPCSLEEAIENAQKLLTHAAEDAARMINVGIRLGTPRPAGEALLPHVSAG